MASIACLCILGLCCLLAWIKIGTSNLARSTFYRRLDEAADDTTVDPADFHRCSLEQRCDVIKGTRKGAFGKEKETITVYKKVVDELSASSWEELESKGCTESGPKRFRMPDGQILNIYCDMKILGGGWIVIQQNKDNKSHFNYGWEQYKTGFGNNNGNFWIGLMALHQLTKTRTRDLLLDVYLENGSNFVYHHEKMSVGNESESFPITVGAMNLITDELNVYPFYEMSGAKFSTHDKDNDKDKENCAAKYKGGWWYKGGAYTACCILCLNSIEDAKLGIDPLLSGRMLLR